MGHLIPQVEREQQVVEKFVRAEYCGSRPKVGFPTRCRSALPHRKGRITVSDGGTPITLTAHLDARTPTMEG